MLQNDSNTKTPLTLRLRGYWRQRYLWRWQTSYLPRLTWPDKQLPRFVHQCPATMSFISWLRLLDWEKLPSPTERNWFGRTPVPLAAYIGSYLVKLEQGFDSTGKLRHFLVTHPALVWALGFPLVANPDVPHGFSTNDSIPSRRHFNTVLSRLPNDVLQALLTAQVRRLQAVLPGKFGQTISLDTKHILAWVKENNPREYIKEGRYDKTRQPVGDPDCKLGCKRSRNQQVKTPTKQGQAADTITIQNKEFYWGYASGAVVTKLPEWGEFVLAELTDTFDKGDVRYFFPLMELVEERLGFRPRYGTLDAAFDAFYVYDYFHNPDHDGFAAVPLNQPNGKVRQFDERGFPLCDAELAMPLRKTYTDRTKAIIPHQRAFYACPLLYPTATADHCPIKHKQWSKGGCSVQIPTSKGARLRCQLDRDSDKYKLIYKQRTAVERIFSQAKARGIERPRLRHQQAITNQNTLIYLLINLRALQRVFAKLDAK
ncbi:MAG: hypothetical protein GY799_29315 [Desulfobulbaceae bacterium]|nr:hypothetical protein [Desulfobulbaceae bacterium]